MASHYKSQPLPKFGEWDVNDPASAEGFTAIFNIARDEKRTGGNITVVATESLKSQTKEKRKHKHSFKTWFSCVSQATILVLVFFSISISQPSITQTSFIKRKPIKFKTKKAIKLKDEGSVRSNGHEMGQINGGYNFSPRLSCVLPLIMIFSTVTVSK
ncbi:hypothetical protein V6N13_135083 [Hibiscus sabdariffa]